MKTPKQYRRVGFNSAQKQIAFMQKSIDAEKRMMDAKKEMQIRMGEIRGNK